MMPWSGLFYLTVTDEFYSTEYGIECFLIVPYI